MKPNTEQFTIAKLEIYIKKILHDQNQLSLVDPASLVTGLIHQVAAQLATDSVESSSLEEKVVLSIAIRLKAEEFMVSRINDQPFWEGIDNNQTMKLIKRFKNDFPAEKELIKIVEQVNLMTPENIHLNSFMYEPILDISAHHLKKLYSEVCAI
jgi:hypothetical protein